MKGCLVMVIIALLGLFLFGQVGNRIVQVPPGGQIFVGNEVRLDWEPVSQPDNYSYQWQLVPAKSIPGNSSSIKYIVKEPGVCRIRCTRSDGNSAELQLVVRENRSIEMFPRNPIEGETLNLEAQNFNSSVIKWDFGDSTILSGSQKVSHIFKQSGVYTIKAYDFAGQATVPVERRIKVEIDNRSIGVSPNVLYTGIAVGLTAVNFQGQSVRWEFGDGQTAVTSPTTTHTFIQPGVTRIRAIDYSGRSDMTIEKTVQLQPDNRRLWLSSPPISGEAVDVRLENVQPGNFNWSFSDGERSNGSSVTGKVLGIAGALDVTVEDPSGNYPPFKGTVMIEPDLRSVNVSADSVIPGEEVTLKATQFKGPNVKWILGDGTVKTSAPRQMSYSFTKTGVYEIKAIDYDGQSRKEFSKTIQVQEITPGFQIQLLEFLFQEGKYYAIVNRKGASPSYRLKIMAGGRGLLKGKWLLDGAVIGLFEAQIFEKKPVIVESAFMVKLPVQDLGLHHFSFQFTNYSYGGKIPRLRYFVAEVPALKIVDPAQDSKLGDVDSIVLRWSGPKGGGPYEVALSQVPFQFLPDNNIEWVSAGMETSYRWNLEEITKKGWIYWHVRQLDAAGNVVITSEISSFKIDR